MNTQQAPNKAVEANMEYLSGGKTPYERLRHANLKMLDAIRAVPGWRDIPALRTHFQQSRESLSIARMLRTEGEG